MLDCDKRSNRPVRRTRGAFVVIAIGLALALGYGSSGYLGKVGEVQAQEQKNAGQTPPPNDEKPHKPGHYKKHCKEPQTYEEADLCQQWRVAGSTERIRALTAAQLSNSRHWFFDCLASL